MENDKKLMERAIKSGNLQERANGNKKYGSSDFSGWTREQIDKLQFQTVLDICCGTGNQLALYAERAEVTDMVGVDLSKESLQMASERLKDLGFKGNVKLLDCPMEEMFSVKQIANLKFDLISCFYGLYYAKDVNTVLKQAVDHLAPSGEILIVGPYGLNNRSIFDILSRYFTLPELVTRSATTFMEAEVIPCLSKIADVRTETFVNRISYPSVEEVMEYWQASTFYEEEFHDAVQMDIEDQFRENGQFVIEKYVMACFGRAR